MNNILDYLLNYFTDIFMNYILDSFVVLQNIL